MKKILVLTVLAVGMAMPPLHAQLAVIDSAAGGLLAGSYIEQITHYAQIVAQWGKEIDHMAAQIQHMGEVTQRAVQNLQSAGNIHSWKDFMDWYNRQLYYERMTMDAFKNANINIGKKNYKFSDAEGIAYGIKDTYIDYWNKEFTEEQRREMWLGLGLTPANYAFVQPLRAKAHSIYQQNLFATQVQNEEAKNDMAKNNEWNEKMAADKDKPTGEKMGEKEILEGILETGLRTNKGINDLNMYAARDAELKANEAYLNQTPALAPPLSEWAPDGFSPLEMSKYK